MSNYNKFKTAMEKLGNKVNFSTIELNDTGKNSSSFYTKLIDLFNKLPSQPETKGCKFAFNKALTKDENYYIYLTPDTTTCVTDIQKTQAFKNSRLTFHSNENAIGMKGSKENNNTKLDDQDKEREEYRKIFYGDNPLLQTFNTNEGITTEGLMEDINRIKSIMNG